jgi:hypothetical protein
VSDSPRREQDRLVEAVESQLRHRRKGTTNLETQIGHLQMLANAYLDGPRPQLRPNAPGWWVVWSTNGERRRVSADAEWRYFDIAEVSMLAWSPTVRFYGPFARHPFDIPITQLFDDPPRHPGGKEDT